MNEKETYTHFENCYHVKGQPYRILRSYVELDTYDMFIVEYQLFEVEECRHMASCSQTVYNSGFSNYKLKLHADMLDVNAALSLLQLCIDDDVIERKNKDHMELKEMLHKIYSNKINTIQENQFFNKYT